MRALEAIAHLCHRGTPFAEVATELVVELRRVMPHYARITLYALRERALVRLAGHGDDGNAASPPGASDPAGLAATRAVPVLERRTDGQGYRLAVPVLAGREVLGVLAVESGPTDALSPADTQMLERVAELLAAARHGDPTERPHGAATRAIHAGEDLFEGLAPVGYPIVPSATYAFRDMEDMARVLRDGGSGFLYSRWGNPTVRAVERKLRTIEGAEQSLLFSSGMGAIAATVLSLLEQGDTLVACTALYGETLRLFGRLGRFGITVTYVAPEHLPRIAEYVTPQTRAVYFEPVINPTLRVVDPRPIAAACRARGVLTITDNTFATPHNLRPLELGVDLVLHSVTKYLSGHSDLTGGVVSGSAALLARIEPMRRSLGATLGAFDAYLLGRGMKTFPVRMREHAANARQVAEFLTGHPAVARVLYPGLPNHPDHAIANTLLTTAGGMVTFEMRDGQAAAEALVRRLTLARCAASLGGVETLVSLPVMSSHYNLPDAQLAAAGISRGMVRLSVGLEDAHDIVADLRQALA